MKTEPAHLHHVLASLASGAALRWADSQSTRENTHQVHLRPCLPKHSHQSVSFRTVDEHDVSQVGRPRLSANCVRPWQMRGNPSAFESNHTSPALVHPSSRPLWRVRLHRQAWCLRRDENERDRAGTDASPEPAPCTSCVLCFVRRMSLIISHQPASLTGPHMSSLVGVPMVLSRTHHDSPIQRPCSTGRRLSFGLDSSFSSPLTSQPRGEGN